MRPEACELKPANYPFSIEIPTRFGDLDQLGHVNNVAAAGILEDARVRFAKWTRKEQPDKLRQKTRVVTVSVLYNYLKEVFYPQPVTVYVAVFDIGNSSYTITSLMLQAGQPVVHCRAKLVRSEDGKSSPLPASLKAELELCRLQRD